MVTHNISALILQKEKAIDSLKQLLKHYPKGVLHIYNNGKYTKWYWKNGNSFSYIPKKKRKLAESLAEKQYITCKINDLKKQITLLNNYDHLINHSSSLQILSNPEYHSLLHSLLLPTDSWVQEEYKKNPYLPENLILKSISGNLLRSKSEVIIDMALYLNKIPYRYECILNLGEFVFYPDFTIKHPQTGELYYWEHFGKMDSSDYIRDTCHKIQTYADYGIIPTINLITTYETKDHPLDSATVDEIVRKYFL